MPCLQHLPNLPKLINECRSILVSEGDVLIKQLNAMSCHVLVELERVGFLSCHIICWKRIGAGRTNCSCHQQLEPYIAEYLNNTKAGWMLTSYLKDDDC